MVSKELENQTIDNLNKSVKPSDNPHYTLKHRQTIKKDGLYMCIGSYPRSGRNYLDKLLSECVSPTVHFGFEHNYETITSYNYKPCVLLLRHPLYACLSYVEYAHKNKYIKFPHKELYHPDNKNTFYEHLRYMVIEWFWSYDKMITLDWKCILRYETLVFKPIDTIKTILETCNISYDSIDENEISNIGDIQALKKKKQKKYKPRSLWNCPFYNRKDIVDIWEYVDTNLKSRSLCLGWV